MGFYLLLLLIIPFLWFIGPLFHGLKWMLIGLIVGVILTCLLQTHWIQSCLHSYFHPSSFSFSPLSMNSSMIATTTTTTSQSMSSTSALNDPHVSKTKEWIPSFLISPCVQALVSIIESALPTTQNFHDLLTSAFSTVLTRLNASQPLPLDHIIGGILLLTGTNTTGQTASSQSSLIRSILSLLQSFGLTSSSSSRSVSSSLVSSSSSTTVSVHKSSTSSAVSSELLLYGLSNPVVQSLNAEQQTLLLQALSVHSANSPVLCPITLDELIILSSSTSTHARLVTGVSALFEPTHCFLYKTSALRSWSQQSSINPVTRRVFDQIYPLT